MTLFDTEVEKDYFIKGIYVEAGIARRLQALGLNEGVKIRILNKKKRGALIIKVRGTRLALGKHLSCNIEVKEACA